MQSSFLKSRTHLLALLISDKASTVIEYKSKYTFNEKAIKFIDNNIQWMVKSILLR